MVLDKVVEYFHYWYRYRNSEDVPDMEIPVELCLELLAAADYLGLDQYAAQPCIATTDCFDTNLIQGEYGHEVRSYEILTQIWASRVCPNLSI